MGSWATPTYQTEKKRTTKLYYNDMIFSIYIIIFNFLHFFILSIPIFYFFYFNFSVYIIYIPIFFFSAFLLFSFPFSIFFLSAFIFHCFFTQFLSFSLFHHFFFFCLFSFFLQFFFCYFYYFWFWGLVAGCVRLFSRSIFIIHLYMPINWNMKKEQLYVASFDQRKRSRQSSNDNSCNSSKKLSVVLQVKRSQICTCLYGRKLPRAPETALPRVTLGELSFKTILFSYWSCERQKLISWRTAVVQG